MNPIGLVMAFVFFWLMVGAGAFLVIWALVLVSRRSLTLGIVGTEMNGPGSRELLVIAALLVIGAVLIYLGVSASFNVIFH
ncbi:MAG: hypothetical protein M1343_14085 [Chloroflexi bacterium]|nr:hypothetical protein [Chloroflexota bacterium]MDA8186613.1 hypothetical protein [Dehalococcoidales bacterium]